MCVGKAVYKMAKKFRAERSGRVIDEAESPGPPHAQSPKGTWRADRQFSAPVIDIYRERLYFLGDTLVIRLNTTEN